MRNGLVGLGGGRGFYRRLKLGGRGEWKVS